MSFFTPEQLVKLDRTEIPHHIAIVPDGNRRWAKKQNSPPLEGHRVGCETLMSLINAAKELEIKILTFYGFSTENWKRSKNEVEGLMDLLLSYLKEQTPRMVEDDIQFHTIGELSKIRIDVQKQIELTKNATRHCSSIQFVIALNYGGRDEICRAIKRIIKDYDSKRIFKEDITESLISKYLDTSPWKDPELLIRPGGEKRISNFLLWQISYSEIYTTPVLWPDFSPNHLLEAILNYQSRNLRLGA